MMCQMGPSGSNFDGFNKETLFDTTKDRPVKSVIQVGCVNTDPSHLWSVLAHEKRVLGWLVFWCVEYLSPDCVSLAKIEIH